MRTILHPSPEAVFERALTTAEASKLSTLLLRLKDSFEPT